MHALDANTTGIYNYAFGNHALSANTTASYNVAMGYGALQSSTTAAGNTAVGHMALQDTTTGANNVAIGYKALTDNVTGTLGDTFYCFLRYKGFGIASFLIPFMMFFWGIALIKKSNIKKTLIIS